MADNTAMAKGEPSALEKLKAQMGPRLADVATDHLTPERLLRLFGAHASGDQALQRCSMQSLASSLLLASQLGLEPGGPLGHLYLVPYKTTCTPIIGYKGMLQLIRNTGEVKRINAQVFYRQEMEAGDIELSLEPPEVRHRWTGGTYGDDDIAGAYCVVEGHNGETYLGIVTRAEIDARRKRSAAGGSGPWKTDFAAMARKCAVRKLFGGGTVPISAEKMGAISQAMAEDGDSGNGAAPVTRAARNISMFRSATEPAPEPVETTAEVVDAPSSETPYTLAIKAARDMGASNEEIRAAQAEAGIDTVPIGEWQVEHGDMLLSALELMKGA